MVEGERISDIHKMIPEKILKEGGPKEVLVHWRGEG